ncbi:MAG: M24 family metallopeptidase [Candidatus Hodarchaeales archaeon]
MVRFITKEKLTQLYDSLESNGIDILYIYDSENHREINLKYITGHPEDATLFLDIKNRQTILIPWDYQLAEKYSEADTIVDVSEYNGSVIAATVETIKNIVETKPKIGVLHSIAYSSVRSILDKVDDADIIYDPLKIDRVLENLRSTKSSLELNLLQKSFDISNKLVDEMSDNLVNKWDKKNFREIDLAIFVEGRMREIGAEAIGFETLVASSKRSWQIHTYPRADTKLGLYRKGLALIDFGVKAEDFTSDVTLPFVFGKKNAKMEKIVETVRNAHDEAIDALNELTYLHEVAEKAYEIIEKEGFRMPHALGHGIGLTVHDAPVLRRKPVHETLLKYWKAIEIKEGMVVTIEPGIYEQDVGGFRLENDVVITKNGPKVVTNSRPIEIAL